MVPPAALPGPDRGLSQKRTAPTFGKAREAPTEPQRHLLKFGFVSLYLGAQGGWQILIASCLEYLPKVDAQFVIFSQCLNYSYPLLKNRNLASFFGIFPLITGPLFYLMLYSQPETLVC